MADILDEEWKQNRGVEIASVGIASISYDEESTKLINMRNQGAMLSDPTIQGRLCAGICGSWHGGSRFQCSRICVRFLGMGMSMQGGSGVMGAASEANLRQMEMNRQHAQAAGTADMVVATWICSCGTENTGKNSVRNVENRCRLRGSVPVGQKIPENSVRNVENRHRRHVETCSCGAVNTGKFCAECGKPKA